MYEEGTPVSPKRSALQSNNASVFAPTGLYTDDGYADCCGWFFTICEQMSAVVTGKIGAILTSFLMRVDSCVYDTHVGPTTARDQ